MSNGQPLGALATGATLFGTWSPGLEDVDLYEPSATDIDSIAISISNATSLNTQANAQRSTTEHEETIQSVLNGDNTNDVNVPFVHTSSPMSTPPPISDPSLAPGSPQISHNGAANTNTGSRRDSAAGNDLSARQNSSTMQNLRQDSNARKDSSSTDNKDLDARQDSYSRRNSDIGRDQRSRTGSDPLEPVHTSSGLPRHLRDEQKLVYSGSPLNPANSHEEFRRLSRHRRSSRRHPTPPIANLAFSADPYAGMDFHATPHMYAPPLPIPQYMPPPMVDYSHIYSSNIQSNYQLPLDVPIPSPASPLWPGSRIIPPGIPPAMPIQNSPATRQSISSNIVAAAAMTPETKVYPSIPRPMSPPAGFQPVDPNAGSFADYNPYYMTPDLQSLYSSIPGPMPLPSSSQRTTMDTPMPPPLPPSQPTWYQPPPRQSRGRSYSGIDGPDGPFTPSRQYYRQYERESGEYRPSRSYSRSPSPEYYRSSRSRRPHSRGYSSFKYDTSTSSSDFMHPDLNHQRARTGRLWSRFLNFFKLSFDHRQPTAQFHDPYSRDRTTEEPVTLFFIAGQIYFHLLLRLPSLYFHRVKMIFDETNLNLHGIIDMILETTGGPDLKDKSQVADMQIVDPVVHKIQAQYGKLKSSWESFIDSLIREWETFNIVSVMLLTAILTILQITTAATDPVTRYAALFSLICSLMSLLFGCMYIIRFGTMRKTFAAVEWVKFARRSSQSVIWNVWVLLSIPAIWLTWSIILFSVAIISFVWRTNPADDNASTLILSSTGLLVTRIAMSAVFGLGLLNALLITNTFRLYGEALHEDWRMWTDEWQKDKAFERPINSLFPGNALPGGYISHLNYGQPQGNKLRGLSHSFGATLGAVYRAPSIFFPQQPPVMPPAPAFSPLYADLVDRKPSRRRRRRTGRHHTRGYEERDSSATSSSSESRSPRQRIRPRSSPPAEPPQYARPWERDPPARSNVYSQTPQIPGYNLPPNVVLRRSTRSHPPYVDTTEIQYSKGAPFIPPDMSSPSDISEEHDPQSHVRFRLPLESTRGSNDWGAYTSSFEGHPSLKIIGPSSSSAIGIVQESNNVQIPKPFDVLRRRRPT